jgi:hypothetical protein
MNNSLKQMSNISYFLIGVSVVIVAYIAAPIWQYSDARINAHEEAHLESYARQGIHAERIQHNAILSDRQTVQGLIAGYTRDYDTIFYLSVIITVTAFAFNFVTGVGLASVFISFPWFMHFVISEEMMHPKSDISQIVRISGGSIHNWISSITATPVWWLIIMTVVHGMMYVFMTPLAAQHQMQNQERARSASTEKDVAQSSADRIDSWMSENYDP